MSLNATIIEIPAQSSASDAEILGAQITELCSYIYAAEARLLALIREFDEKKHWETLGLCSCAHWLNLKCGIGMNAAREKVRVAHALAGLPGITERFARGELSYSKVRAMTRIANAENEDYLLMIARHGTAYHVEKLVSKFRTASRLQDTEIANQQHRDRDVSHYYDHDGCLVIKARLPAEQGALIVKALEMAMDQDFAGSTPNPKPGSNPKPGTEDVTAETQTDLAEEEEEEQRSIGARRADALVDIAETYMNNNESSGSTADRYQVVVHVTAETSDIEDGPHVTAETSRRIACDCSVVGIKEDELGEPLSIGRRSRSIPPPMRRALRIRDGSCRFPGCTHTRYVDGHHVEHWASGGETSLSNLVLLCRHHHHLVHEGGYVCEKTSSGEVIFRSPENRPLDNLSALPGLQRTQQLQTWLDGAFFDANIDSDSCVAQWYAGEKMDWDLAVSALF